MSEPRVHPFGLVFGGLAAERFPGIAAVTGGEPELDGFLAAEPAIQLLHDLRPETGLGDAIDDFVVLVHAAFRFWMDGEQTVVLEEVGTRELIRDAQRAGVDGVPSGGSATMPLVTRYIQVSPRLIWSKLEDQEHHEPLDGWFAVPAAGVLRVVACLGLHAARPGLSVLAVEGGQPAGRSPPAAILFAPAMSGGETAGLHSVSTPMELLLLAWHAVGLP